MTSSSLAKALGWCGVGEGWECGGWIEGEGGVGGECGGVGGVG